MLSTWLQVLFDNAAGRALQQRNGLLIEQRDGQEIYLRAV